MVSSVVPGGFHQVQVQYTYLKVYTYLHAYVLLCPYSSAASHASTTLDKAPGNQCAVRKATFSSMSSTPEHDQRMQEIAGKECMQEARQSGRGKTGQTRTMKALLCDIQLLACVAAVHVHGLSAGSSCESLDLASMHCYCAVYWHSLLLLTG